MAVIVKVSGPQGDVYFEAEPTAADLVEIGLRDRAEDVIKDAVTGYETLVSTLRRCTADVITAVDSLSTVSGRATLRTAQVEVGVKLTAAGNVVVAKGTAEANLKVVLTWDLQ